METDVNQTWKQFLRFVKERDYHAITKNAILKYINSPQSYISNTVKPLNKFQDEFFSNNCSTSTIIEWLRGYSLYWSVTKGNEDWGEFQTKYKHHVNFKLKDLTYLNFVNFNAKHNNI